jgi:hypothetical protein
MDDLENSDDQNRPGDDERAEERGHVDIAKDDETADNKNDA